MKLLFKAVAAAAGEPRLTVLMFHRVAAEPDELFPLEVDRSRFDAVCGWVRRWFNVLPLDSAVERLEQGTLPRRALSITFDDGYADNHDVALPVLEQHGISATFFIATGFLDGGRMWNDTLIEAVRRTPLTLLDLRGRGWPGLDRVLALGTVDERRASLLALIAAVKYMPPDARLRRVEELAGLLKARLPNDLMMSTQQVRALHARGMQIGAHTESHPILRTLSDAAAAAEMGSSRDRLQALIDAPVTLFAYPNGKPGQDFDARDTSLARQLGFQAAFTTAAGVSTGASDRYQLPRFTPWRRQRAAFAAQLARNLMSPA